MADINVLDLTEVTPGSGDDLIAFDRVTGEAKSVRYSVIDTAIKNLLKEVAFQTRDDGAIDNPNINPDNIMDTSLYNLSTKPQLPDDTSWFYVFTFRHSNTNTYRTQLAIKMVTGEMYVRSINGEGTTWTSWKQLAFLNHISTAGKTGNYNDLSNKPTIPGAGQGISLQNGNFKINFGSTSGTACEGNDHRVVNALQYGGVAHITSVEFNGQGAHYIDFHYGGATSDYTSRIIENEAGNIAFTNSVTFDGSLFGEAGIWNNPSVGGLVHFDGQPYVVIDGKRHHFALTD